MGYSLRGEDMTAKTIHIRQAVSADISLLSSLIRESFRDVAERFSLTNENCPKHPSNCTDQWIENDLAKGITYYVLKSNGTPAGCVALEKATPDLTYLERLAVLPKSRRRGLGKALVDHLFAQARTAGARQISIV